MLNTVKQMLESSPLAVELHQLAWNALSSITKSAPNINKFKNLLDRRVPDLLVNKLDCYSYFFLKDNCSMFVQT